MAEYEFIHGAYHAPLSDTRECVRWGMPRQPRRPNPLDVLDDIVEKAVETAFDKGANWINGLQEKAAAAPPAGPAPAGPAGTRPVVYICLYCRKGVHLPGMELVHPDREFGLCKPCFAFGFQAAAEKIAYLKKRAQGAVAPAAAAPAAAVTPPWTILGIDKNASADEIKKAWKGLAATYHPDRVQPGPDSTAQKEAMVLKFEEVTRARDVMLRLRNVTT